MGQGAGVGWEDGRWRRGRAAAGGRGRAETVGFLLSAVQAFMLRVSVALTN